MCSLPLKEKHAPPVFTCDFSSIIGRQRMHHKCFLLNQFLRTSKEAHKLTFLCGLLFSRNNFKNAANQYVFCRSSIYIVRRAKFEDLLVKGIIHTKQSKKDITQHDQIQFEKAAVGPTEKQQAGYFKTAKTSVRFSLSTSFAMAQKYINEIRLH